MSSEDRCARIVKPWLGHKSLDLGIESLRGIAIVLMVSGHVIGASAVQGLGVADDSGWRLFYRALEDLRMPLFTVLSGFLYAHRPVVAANGLGPLIKGKLRRLMLPFATVTTIFFNVKIIVPGTNEKPAFGDMWKAYVFGYEHLWFLQAVLICFVISGLLDAAGSLQSVRSWAAIVGLATVFYVLVEIPAVVAVFSVNGGLRLLPFFLLGVGFNRFASELLQPPLLVLSIVLFVPLYALRIGLIVKGVAMPVLVDRALSVTVAALVVLILVAARERFEWRPMVWLGQFSFGIYLLHVFGAAGSRIVAVRLGVSDTAVLFAIGIVAGLALPIFLERTLGQLRVVGWGLLGKRSTRI